MSQVNFTLDSFIQYVGRLPTSRTRSRNVRGHYIGFRRINDNWYRFDDAVVHQINRQNSYSVNLVIYRRQDVPQFISGSDLSCIHVLGPVTILNRKSATANVKDSMSKDNEDNVNGSERLKPPLITPSKESPKESTKYSTPLKPEHPDRVQPSRGNKDFVIYYAYDSLSSSDEEPVDRTHTDHEYIPPRNKGNYKFTLLINFTFQRIFLLNI